MLLFTNRFCTSIAFLLMLFISNNVFSATLSIADNLVLRELDDKRLDDNFFTSKKNVELSKGNHTLLVKYKDVYEDLDFAEERLVESDLFIVMFELKDQQKLKLMTPKIKDLAAAEKFSKSPEIMIVDEHNTSLVLTLQKYEDYKLAKQVEKVVIALPLSNTLVKDGKNTNEVDTVARAKDAVKDEKQAFNEQVLTHTKSLPMLKYWWKQASEKEKKDFILYVKDNNNE